VWVGSSAWRDRMGRRLQAVQIILSSTHYICIVSTVVAASVFETGVCGVLLIHSSKYWLYTPLFFPYYLAHFLFRTLSIWHTFLFRTLPIWHTSYLAQFLFDTLPIWHNSYLAHFLFDILPIWYNSYLAQFQFDTLPIWYTSYLTHFLFGTIPIWHNSNLTHFLFGTLPQPPKIQLVWRIIKYTEIIRQLLSSLQMNVILSKD
jgi:hypothetical protein